MTPLVRVCQAITVFGYTLLPTLLSFGAKSASYENLFRPVPSNDYYDFMLLAICFSAAGVYLHTEKQSADRMGDAFDVFLLLFPAVVGILSAISSIPVSAAFWLIFAGSMCMTMFYRHRRVSWTPTWNRSCSTWFFTVFIVIIAAGFFSFPVAQPWSGAPEPFVRWCPFTVPGELIWRGIFGTYAVTMLLTAIEGPAKHHNYVLFLAVSGIVHAVIMLIMNLADRSAGLSNGNAEHLYGDVPGWFFIGLVAAMIWRFDIRSSQKNTPI